MPKAIADQFTTITSSGWSATTKLMQATAVGGANSVATQMSFPAASTGNVTQRMVPQATATTTAIPAAPAAWSGVGWASPVLDGANVHAVTTDLSAYTITFLVANSGWTTAPTVTWTAVLYLGEPNGGPMVEIGRGTSGAAAAGTVSITVTPGATKSSGASTSPRLCIELYGVVGVGVGGLGTNLITVATAGTTARLSTGGAYTSQWERTGVVTGTGTAVLARRITGARTFTVSGSGTPVMSKVLNLARSAAVTATGTAGSSKVLSAKRSAAVTGTGSVVLGPRTIRKAPLVVTGTGTAVAARKVTAARSFAVSASGAAGFARSLIFGRVFTVTVTGATSMRIELPQAALNRITVGGPVDYPVTNGTKTVAGVTRGAAGAIVGGCTVYLIRQSDGLRCQTATSHATTGAYSFVRDATDPNSYRVVALLAGSPETHGITDLLTPV